MKARKPSLFWASGACVLVTLGACSGEQMPTGQTRGAAEARPKQLDPKVMSVAKDTFSNYMVFDEANLLSAEDVTVSNEGNGGALALWGDKGGDTNRSQNYATADGIVNQQYYDSISANRREINKQVRLIDKYKSTRDKYASNPDDPRYKTADESFQLAQKDYQSLKSNRMDLLLRNAKSLKSYPCPKVRARAAQQEQELMSFVKSNTGNNSQNTFSNPTTVNSPSTQNFPSIAPIKSTLSNQDNSQNQLGFRQFSGRTQQTFSQKCQAKSTIQDESGSCQFYGKERSGPFSRFKTQLSGVREKFFGFFHPKSHSTRRTEEKSFQLAESLGSDGKPVSYDLFVTSVPGVDATVIGGDQFTVCETEAVKGKEGNQNNGCVTFLGTIGKPGKETGQVPVYDEAGQCNPFYFFVKSSDPAVTSNIEPESVTHTFVGSGNTYALKLTLDFGDVKTGLTLPLGPQYNTKSPFLFYVKTTKGPVGTCVQ